MVSYMGSFTNKISSIKTMFYNLWQMVRFESQETIPRAIIMQMLQDHYNTKATHQRTLVHMAQKEIKSNTSDLNLISQNLSLLINLQLVREHMVFNMESAG